MTHDNRLSDSEWDEMDSLRRAIKDGPPAVAAHKMERFTELFVRTLPYEGDTIAPVVNVNDGSA
ncbi:MAG: hypothetical protein ACO3HP_04735 [Candidatus Nanopelagicaceae bacterium]